MRILTVTASILPALALASCSAAATGDSAPTASTTGAMVAGERVELQDTSPFMAESHADLDRPWALDFEPGTGRVFVTQKGGAIMVLHPGTGETGIVTGDLPSVVDEGQGGLGDIVFGPNYADDGHLYLSWAQDAGGGQTVAAVGRGVLRCDDGATCSLTGFEEIWRQSRGGARPGHYSHRIAFSPDGRHMFVASGDRQEQDPAQDMSNNLGTIVRLNLDGTPAAGNPMASRGSPMNQVWSWGHRNVLGLAFAPDGQLWEVEHGPAGGDELNRVDRGANYGWPIRSNGDNYNGTDIPDHTADDGFAKPAIHWTPVIAPGGMIIYDGTMFADWRGQALIANLRTTSISRVTLNGAANSADEASRYEFPVRLRDIAQGPDGSIWVIEDGEDARLLRLTPAPAG